MPSLDNRVADLEEQVYRLMEMLRLAQGPVPMQIVTDPTGLVINYDRIVGAYTYLGKTRSEITAFDGVSVMGRGKAFYWQSDVEGNISEIDAGPDGGVVFSMLTSPIPAETFVLMVKEPYSERLIIVNIFGEEPDLTVVTDVECIDGILYITKKQITGNFIVTDP
jgi:hypothetical protein